MPNNNEKDNENTQVIENNNIRLEDKEIKIEDIKKTIKSKGVLPKEEKEQIKKVIKTNLWIAIAVVVYLIFLSLGCRNINIDAYIIDLKVFGMCILITSIILIENAYKKDNGKLAIYGIELIVLTIATVGLIYSRLNIANKFNFIIYVMIGFVILYYVIKLIVSYYKMKKKFIIENMKDIIKK